MPDGVNSEVIGALEWQCFGRQRHPAFSGWGRRSWSQWPHLAVRVGDSLTSPVNLAASTAGLKRNIAGWVPHFLRHRSRPGWLRFVDYPALDCDGREVGALSGRKQTGSVSNRTAPVRHDLERPPKHRSRDNVVARAIATDRQE